MVATADPTRWTPEEVAEGRAAYPAPADPASEHATSAYNPTPGARPPPPAPARPRGARGTSSSSGPAGSVSAGPASPGGPGGGWGTASAPPPRAFREPGMPGDSPLGKIRGARAQPLRGDERVGTSVSERPPEGRGLGGPTWDCL